MYLETLDVSKQLIITIVHYWFNYLIGFIWVCLTKDVYKILKLIFCILHLNLISYIVFNQPFKTI